MLLLSFVISPIEINGQLFPHATVVVSVTSKSVSHSFSNDITCSHEDSHPKTLLAKKKKVSWK